jgi:ATP-binding cassette subfamily C protein
MRYGIEGTVYTGVALAVSWRATLVAALTAVAMLVLLSGFVRLSERAGRRQTGLLKSLLARLTDMLQAIKMLKATARESVLAPLLEADTEQLNRALRQRVLGKEGLRSLQEPVAVAFMALGLYLAITRWGMALSSLLVLLLVLARAVSRLGKVQRKYLTMVTEASALWSLHDLAATAEAEAEPSTGRRPARFEDVIVLSDVRLAYGGAPVLDGISLEIPARAITVLVGTSGVGKTTIADLVAGLVRHDAGEVRVDGVPLAELDLRRWRQGIGYVPQEMLLLNDSVRRNVTLGDAELDDARVERALRRAGAWEFVAALPEGLDASVGERGSLLSGGQRQRIALARALVHEPRLLVLDEATAALDPEGEAALWETLRELSRSTTILAIAHESAAVAVADRIYRVEAGRASVLPARAPRRRTPLRIPAAG